MLQFFEKFDIYFQRTACNPYTMPFIQSRIDYANEIYGDASKKLIQRTQVHQNRILKILQYKNPHASTNAAHRDFGMPKISDQYELRILKLMHLYTYSKAKLPDVF